MIANEHRQYKDPIVSQWHKHPQIIENELMSLLRNVCLVGFQIFSTGTDGVEIGVERIKAKMSLG